MILRARQTTFVFPRPVLVMGIVNVTPDSFSDGGRYFEPGPAIEHGLRLAQQGADILDVGGESTRPKAEPVSEDEESRRVLPVLSALSSQCATPLSIDTRKVSVARKALDAGASILNDIAGNRTDSEMWKLAAQSGAAYVLMHMKGTPQTMQDQAEYRDVIDDVSHFFSEQLQRVFDSGVHPEQVVLDPGIGFAKTAEHNLQLLARLNRLTIHQRPLLIGASRKSFIGKVLGTGERLPGSLACAVWAALNGARIIRTHDVTETVQALRMVQEIGAHGE